MKQKLIGIEDLPDNFGVKLGDKFRKKLFDRAINNSGGVQRLSNILNCDRTSIWQWGKVIRLTRISILKKIAQIAEFEFRDLESKIVAIRRKRINGKDFIKIKFPISASPELASLIGHIMGDGNLSERQFSFFNQRREIIDEVINNVNKVFSSDIVPEEFNKDGGWEIEFPTNIGKLLKMAGSPLGIKVKKDFGIPIWIKGGSSKIKKNFVRALFDDEGCIDVKRKTIVFGMSKTKRLMNSHKRFLNDLRKLLKELKVESNPTQKPQPNKSGTFHVCFSIKTEHKNILRFSKNVGFTHTSKVQNLAKIY